MMFGMLADSSAVFVSKAGVGLPSGVIGIAFMHLQYPKFKNSASAGDVYGNTSGVFPATVIPGIVHVSV
jgi:hypothetical protein